MSIVAIYNMKGGVGKTTAAVNLSHCAAASGRRTLLWDLDPQAASSFAFRVRPRVAGFKRKSLENGRALAEAVKETDFPNLDLLPADFAYRKLDRQLDRFDRPVEVVADLVKTIAHGYEAAFLDCPAGFSLLTEGIFASADAVLVPTIPTVLSLRSLARVIARALRHDPLPVLAPFFSMVDRRKALHQRACLWSAEQGELFLSSHVPYASVVEQMAVRRLPLAVFAPGDAATEAFAGIWSEVLTRLERGSAATASARVRLEGLPDAIESLMVALDSSAEPQAALNMTNDACIIHRFDTDRCDLEQCGFVLEVQERAGGFCIVAHDARPGPGDPRVQIDGRWAAQILSGVMSPLSALERRLGRPVPRVVQRARAAAGDRHLRRIDSRVAGTPAPPTQPVSVRRV